MLYIKNVTWIIKLYNTNCNMVNNPTEKLYNLYIMILNYNKKSILKLILKVIKSNIK